jgi:hypothetical protein
MLHVTYRNLSDRFYRQFLAILLISGFKAIDRCGGKDCFVDGEGFRVQTHSLTLAVQ